MSFKDTMRVRHFDYQNNDPRKQCGIVEGTQTFTDVLRNAEIINSEFCAYKTLMLKSQTPKDDDIPDEPTEPVIQVDLGGFPLLTRTKSVGGGGVEIADAGLTWIEHDPYDKPNSQRAGRLQINRLDFSENKMTTRILRNAYNGYFLRLGGLYGNGVGYAMAGTELPPAFVEEHDMFENCDIGEVNQNKIRMSHYSTDEEFAYI